MSDLIERARLTTEEIESLIERELADAATAKALWACAEWLQGLPEGVEYITGDDRAIYLTRVASGAQLAHVLNQAGIERPKGGIWCRECHNATDYVYTADDLCETCHNVENSKAGIPRPTTVVSKP